MNVRMVTVKRDVSDLNGVERRDCQDEFADKTAQRYTRERAIYDLDSLLPLHWDTARLICLVPAHAS